MQTIYALLDPRTSKVRYVGRAKDVKRRVSQHFIGRHCPSTAAVQAWIDELTTISLIPEWKIVEESNREQYWIDFYKAKGEADLNVKRYLSEEQKQRMTEGRRASPNMYKSIAVRKPRPRHKRLGQEYRQQIAATMKKVWAERRTNGYRKPTVSAKTKQLISDNMTRIWKARKEETLGGVEVMDQRQDQTTGEGVLSL